MQFNEEKENSDSGNSEIGGPVSSKLPLTKAKDISVPPSITNPKNPQLKLISKKRPHAVDDDIAHLSPRRQKFIRSLRTFKDLAGKPSWTEGQKKLCQLYWHANPGFKLKEIAADAEDSGIAITDEEVLRVYDKVKAAFQVLTGSKPV